MGDGVRFDIELRTRRRRVHLRRGDRALQLDRGQARRAAQQAAVPGRRAACSASPRSSTTSRRSSTCSTSSWSGGQAYARDRHRASTGTRLFCLSGRVERPGVYEAPFGVTLRELIDAGGRRRGRAAAAGGHARRRRRARSSRPDELDVRAHVRGHARGRRRRSARAWSWCSTTPSTCGRCCCASPPSSATSRAGSACLAASARCARRRRCTASSNDRPIGSRRGRVRAARGDRAVDARRVDLRPRADGRRTRSSPRFGKLRDLRDQEDQRIEERRDAGAAAPDRRDRDRRRDRQAPEDVDDPRRLPREGIDIPTLCYWRNAHAGERVPRMRGRGEGSRVLVPSCARKVEQGMKVADRLRARANLSRKMVLEFLASTVDLSVTPDVAALDRGVRREAGALRPARAAVEAGERDASAPAITTPPDGAVRRRPSPSRSRSTTTCTSATTRSASSATSASRPAASTAQNTFAIAVAGRGFDARISTEFATRCPTPPASTAATASRVCPTGALMFKTRVRHARRRAPGTRRSRP